MANLSELIRTKNVDDFLDTALEQGEIYAYASNHDTGHVPRFCWKPPTAGTACIEIWGPGGSGARMCCCGFGIPGNSGAYARKQLVFSNDNYADSYLCGCIGYSCGNTDLCFRGCSNPTCTLWSTDAGNTTNLICVQGGKGGFAYCSTSTNGYCCFRQGGFCGTDGFNTCCGIICNHRAGDWIPTASGGDTNCPGLISCTQFFRHQPNCPCAEMHMIAGPPGMNATKGIFAYVANDTDSFISQWSGGNGEHQYTIGALSRNPGHGQPWAYCWSGANNCGCYENEGCIIYTPPGHGGRPPHPCAGVRDHGGRGGHGAIRIRFIRAV